MKCKFRKVLSKQHFKVLKNDLEKDVIENGGSISEIFDVWGDLQFVECSSFVVLDKQRNLQICKPIFITKSVSNLEAIAWHYQEIE